MACSLVLINVGLGTNQCLADLGMPEVGGQPQRSLTVTLGHVGVCLAFQQEQHCFLIVLPYRQPQRCLHVRLRTVDLGLVIDEELENGNVALAPIGGDPERRLAGALTLAARCRSAARSVDVRLRENQDARSLEVSRLRGLEQGSNAAVAGAVYIVPLAYNPLERVMELSVGEVAA